MGLPSLFKRNAKNKQPDAEKALNAVREALEPPVEAMRAQLIREKYGRAVYGDICRTAMFRQFDGLAGIMEDYQYMIAQSVNAKRDRWNVMTVVISERDDGLYQGGQILSQNIKIKAQNVPFFTALEMLAEWEAGLRSMGRAEMNYIALDKLQRDALGKDINILHFKPFGEREGVRYTLMGQPEPTLDGRIVIPGDYAVEDISVDAQVAEVQAISADWSKAMLELSGQALNSKDPFELIVDSMAENGHYAAAAKLFRERVNTFDTQNKNALFSSFAKDIAETGNANRNYYAALVEQERAIRGHSMRAFRESIEKIELEDLRNQLLKAISVVRLAELVAEGKAILKGNTPENEDNTVKALRDQGTKIDVQAHEAGFSKEEAGMLKSAMLTDVPVELPPQLYKLVEQLELFVERHKKWVTTMKRELLQPDHKVGKARLSDYFTSASAGNLYKDTFTWKDDYNKWAVTTNRRMDGTQIWSSSHGYRVISDSSKDKKKDEREP